MTKIIANIFEPHCEIQNIIMNHLANRDSGTRFLWVACGTKFGKTLGAAGGYAYAFPRYPGTTWRWVAPIYKQAKIAWKYLDNILPTGYKYDKKTSLIVKNKTDFIMSIPSLKIESQFWHGQSPEDLEGEAIWGQVNDECAKLKKQVFDSSMTTWTMTQAQVLNISTPRGRNWFYSGCMRAKEEMEAAARENRVPREMFLTAPTADNPFVPRASIEEAKRLLPDRLYRQYYLAEFLEDGSTFPNPIIDSENWRTEYEQDGPIEWWIHPDSKEMTIVAGVDWAKKSDYTVLICIDHTKKPFKIVGFLRFHQKRYTDQVIDIVRFLRKFKYCEMIFHDKTGVGEAIDDILSKVPGLVYHGVVFTNASKALMVNNLITGMEQKNIHFPWWKALIHEFDVYEVETNDLGRMMYSAPDGDHDDIVSSCFLAYAAAEEYGSRDFEVKILEDLPSLEFKKDSWENYMYEELDIDPEEGF